MNRSKCKPRIKIQRPPNAAPNTAFTQVSQPDKDGWRKIRVALNPSDLADDSEASRSRYKVCGNILWAFSIWFFEIEETLRLSCRSPGFTSFDGDIYDANLLTQKPKRRSR